MRKIPAMIGGTLLGAATWGASALVSGAFEPFDSLPGFLVVQIALPLAAALTEFRARRRGVGVCAVGQLSGAEFLSLCDGRRRNPRLGIAGAVTTISLIIVPALVGGAAVLVCKRWRNGAA